VFDTYEPIPHIRYAVKVTEANMAQLAEHIGARVITTPDGRRGIDVTCDGASVHFAPAGTYLIHRDRSHPVVEEGRAFELAYQRRPVPWWVQEREKTAVNRVLGCKQD